MKPYGNLNGKLKYFYYWKRKTTKKIRRVFKKSMRKRPCYDH